MEKAEFLAYLETEEGKMLLEEQKQPLVDKNAEVLGKLAIAKQDLEALKQKEISAASDAASQKTAAEKAKAEKDNDIEAYKQLHESELTTRDDTINTLKSNFAVAELSRLVSSTAAKHSNSPKPLELLLRNRMSTSYDEAGNLRMNVLNEAGEAMVDTNIDTLVESLRTVGENASFFSGTGSSGAGTNVSDTVVSAGKSQIGDDNYNLTEAMGNKLI